MLHAVVCDASVRDAVRETFPEHKMLHPGHAVAGHRFGKIVMLWKPTDEHGVTWVEHDLRCRLAPGGKFVRLV